jgi:DHA1 family multidrug resistance protein-like MFS transporter
MSLGLGAIALAHGIVALVACVIIFSMGSLLVQPTQQTATASMADPSALGSFFGVGSLALALGGGLGNYSGGLLYGLGQQYGTPALPWLVFCSVGMVSALGLALLQHRQNSARALLSRDASSVI